MFRSATFGFVLTVLALIGLVCVWIFAPEFQAEAISIFSPLVVGGAFGAARAEPAGKRPKQPPTLLVLPLLLLVVVGGGCSTTYSGAHARVGLSPLGDAGLTAVLHVDKAEVCRVNGKAASLVVHETTARRICAAFKGRCEWKSRQP